MRKQIYASLLCCLTLLGVQYGQAQIQTLSPYSSIGMGDLTPTTSQHFTDMGGTSVGMFSQGFVNTNNPASYSNLNLTNFEIGGNGKFTKFEQGGEESGFNYVNFTHLMMGADIGEKAGLAFGFLPYSNLGYEITHSPEQVILGSIDTAMSTPSFEGEGGVNKLFFGASYKINNNLSFGSQLYYYFGNLIKREQIEFDNSTFVNTRSETKISVKDIGFDLGLQYSKMLDETRRLTVGATYAPGVKLNSTETSYKYSYSKTAISETILDTLINEQDREGTMEIPTTYALGFSLQEDNKWTVGADVRMRQWSGNSYLGHSPSSLKDEVAFSVGGSYIPNKEDVRYFWKRIEYRGGLKYSTGRLELQSLNSNSLTGVNEIGINFGLGIPMRKTRGTLNLGFEFGQRGTTDNNLIKESYFKTTIAFTFRDKWFIKRKID